MATSPILGIPQVATNQTQKESVINTQAAFLEAASNAGLNVSMAAGDVTLTPQQWTRNVLFIAQAATANQNLFVPPSIRLAAIFNQTSKVVTVSVAGATGGTSLALGPNKSGFIFCDGTNITGLTPTT